MTKSLLSYPLEYFLGYGSSKATLADWERKATTHKNKTLAKAKAKAKRADAHPKQRRKRFKRNVGPSQVVQGTFRRDGRNTSTKVSGRLKSKIFEALNGVSHYNDTSQFQMSTSVNQASWYYNQIGSQSDIQKCFNLCLGNGVDTDAKILLRDYTMTFTVTNLGNVSSFLDCYYLYPRYDLQTGLALSNTLQDGFADYGAAVYTPSGATGADGSGHATTFQVDTALSLYQNPRMCQLFKIAKMQRLEFNPGQVQKITWEMNKPHTLSSDLLNNTFSNFDMNLRKLYRVMVFKVSGQPASDTGAETNVVLSNCKFGFIMEHRYNFVNVSETSPVAAYANGLPALTGNVSVMNDLTAAAGVYSAA